MNFNDLKISTRLTLGFGLMGLLIGIMGTMSMGLAHRADTAFHSIIDDRFPKVLNLHVTKEDVAAVELARTQMLLDTRPESIQRHQATVNRKRKEITQLLDTLGQQITSPQGKTVALAPPDRAETLALTQHTPRAKQQRTAARPMVGNHNNPRPAQGHRTRITTAPQPATYAMAPAGGGEANWESF
jgi:hypothetical protein